MLLFGFFLSVLILSSLNFIEWLVISILPMESHFILVAAFYEEWSDILVKELLIRLASLLLFELTLNE